VGSHLQVAIGIVDAGAVPRICRAIGVSNGGVGIIGARSRRFNMRGGAEESLDALAGMRESLRPHPWPSAPPEHALAYHGRRLGHDPDNLTLGYPGLSLNFLYASVCV